MLINLRNALMAGKRTPTARDYVQDGLVAMWDGIENAGWGVHNPSATTWKDLVGNNDFAQFKTGVAFGDNFIAIPAVQNVAVAPNQYGSTDISTIEAVVSLEGWNGLVLASFSNTTPISRWIGFRANGSINFGHGGFSADASLVKNTIASFSGCFTSPVTIYKNGSVLPLGSAGMTWPTISGSTPMINKVASSYSKSKIYSIRLYSRALTADEIARNYAIDKARFGLP